MESLRERLPPLPSRIPRILFLGNYADPEKKPEGQPGGPSKRRYHQEILAILRDQGLDVVPSSEPEDIYRLVDDYGFVLSLYNRLNFRSLETYVSTVCEYLRKPYLGARPEIRAVADDKHLMKMLARSLDIPTPQWVVIGNKPDAWEKPHFPGPFMVKPRSGANSVGITNGSVQDSWSDVIVESEKLLSHTDRVLVERFAEGIDVTLPVLGGPEPIILPPVQTLTGQPRHILTGEEKQQDSRNLKFNVVDDAWLCHTAALHALRLYDAIKPIDYFRMDLRYDPSYQKLSFLELNICCDLSSTGSFVFSARARGLTHRETVLAALAHSLSRQEL